MAASVPGARSRALASLLLATLAAACSGTPDGSPGSSPGTSTPPTGGPAASPGTSPGTSARLILRVTSEGGFIAPAATLSAVPQVSVYADGRILTPGAVDTIYPAPLLSAVLVRDVGPAGEAAIVAAIRAAGLDRASTADPGIPGDMGTQLFSVDVDGAVVTTRIALGGGLPGRPGVGSPDPASAAALDLLDRLTDPNERWGAADVPTTTLVPQGYRIFVAPGAPASDGPLSPQPTVAWPLSTSLDQFGSPADPDRGIAGLRQGAVLGPDAARLGPILASSNSQTAFISGGMLYTLYVRPLLPDEVPAQG